MKPPEGYVWLWVVKGFDGLFGMIEKWLQQGTPPTPELKRGLTTVRDRLTQVIEKLP